MKRAAALLLMMTMTLCMVQTAWADETMVIMGGMLRLRAQPDFSAEVLGRYASGTTVAVMGKADGWCAVTLPDGNHGYMHSAYLQPVGNHSQQSAQVVSDNGGDVNLRIGAGLDQTVLTTVPVGTRVTVLTAGSEWCSIRLPDGRIGYMMARFLASETGGARYVTSVNGGGVHMRTGPAQTYRSLGVLRVGTQVTLLEPGDTWHRIRYGDNEGFMMSRYLTTKAPVASAIRLSGVTMSTLSPRVGVVLEASVSPRGSQSVCIWTDDAGRFLGTGATYLVQAEDQGQRIRVTATGFGGTVGAVVSGQTAPVGQ